MLSDERLVGIVTEEDFMEIASKLLEQQLAETGSAEGIVAPVGETKREP